MRANPIEMAPGETIPAILHEDADLLVVNKPAGINTHAPGPWAGDGLYEWLRDHHPRWDTLAIAHRLDKDTSGVLVFTLSPAAQRSLAEQFGQHSIAKTYLLLTDRPVDWTRREATSVLVRVGTRYVSRPAAAKGVTAQTRFEVLRREGGRVLVQAEPITGRTHQIRVHAADLGIPIIGDSLYGGTSGPRLCLAAQSIELRHPSTQAPVKFSAPTNFDAPAGLQLRRSLIDPAATNALRWYHGASDRHDNLYVDQFGPYLLSQSPEPFESIRDLNWPALLSSAGARSVYHKQQLKNVGRTKTPEVSPLLRVGEPAPGSFLVSENGVAYEISFREGYSVGLFLDQRENRRRLLRNHVGPGFAVFPNAPQPPTVLNAFAYTCGFSVCAALAGARVSSIDLSRRYLDWGKRNFQHNGLDPAAHHFVAGDVFDWMRRWQRQRRRFSLVILDPPTFSRSKVSGVFQAEKNYPALAQAAAELVESAGVLFCSCNAARLTPAEWMEQVHQGVRQARRRIIQQRYVPQPIDFPISAGEPAYLKTVWLQLGS